MNSEIAKNGGEMRGGLTEIRDAIARTGVGGGRPRVQVAAGLVTSSVRKGRERYISSKLLISLCKACNFLWRKAHRPARIGLSGLRLAYCSTPPHKRIAVSLIKSRTNAFPPRLLTS